MDFRLLVEQILEEGKVMDQVQALLKTGIDLSKDTPRPESAPQDSEIFPLPVVRNGRLGYIEFSNYKGMGFSAFMPKEYKPGYTEKTKDYCGVFDINNFFGAFDNLVARLEALPPIPVPEVKEKDYTAIYKNSTEFLNSLDSVRDTVRPVTVPSFEKSPFYFIKDGKHVGTIMRPRALGSYTSYYNYTAINPKTEAKIQGGRTTFDQAFDAVQLIVTGEIEKAHRARPRLSNKNKSEINREVDTPRPQDVAQQEPYIYVKNKRIAIISYIPSRDSHYGINELLPDGTKIILLHTRFLDDGLDFVDKLFTGKLSPSENKYSAKGFGDGRRPRHSELAEFSKQILSGRSFRYNSNNQNISITYKNMPSGNQNFVAVNLSDGNKYIARADTLGEVIARTDDALSNDVSKQDKVMRFLKLLHEE